MNCKKSVVITISCFLALTMIAIPLRLVNSVTTAIVGVNPEIIDYPLVNQTFTANISITNVTNLAYWQVRLAFNPAIINCTNATVPQDNIFKGYAQDPRVWDLNNTEGFIRIENKLTQAGGVNGSGTLFRIEFKGIMEGTSVLDFQYVMSPIGTVLLDASGLTIPFDTQSGLVKVNIALKDIPNVPFHYQENKYYSGPAALQMIFDFYGENISQQEIAEVARTHPNVTYTDELRRAAHFSNMSTSAGQEMPQNITGYSLRKLGYGAFEKSGLTVPDLQAAIRNNYPVVVSTWYDASKQNSHYRVVVGYNLTHIKLHDPWNKMAWGGAHGGPSIAMNYTAFLTLWNQSDFWGLLVHPWQVTVSFRMLDNQPYVFNVTADVQYISPQTFRDPAYSATSVNVTIILPPELNLEVGENVTKTIGGGSFLPGDSSNINWIVIGNVSGKFNLTVEARGRVFGNVTAHESYPAYNYQDAIGGKDTETIYLGFPGDINGDGEVDIRDVSIAARAFGSYPGHPRWNPIADVNNDDEVNIRDIAAIARKYGTVY